jgi:hypothetical protein
MTHVPVSPLFIPDGRISPAIAGLATLAFPVGSSHYRRSLNADSYTPLAIMVYPPARHITAVTSLPGPESGAVPLKCPPSAESPFVAHNPAQAGLPLVVRRLASHRKALPCSVQKLIRAQLSEIGCILRDILTFLTLLMPDRREKRESRIKKWAES